MTIEALRTPDERFSNIPDYPWQPKYIEGLDGFEGLRLHYLDEGPRDAQQVFLCLHGEPTWSFLYRKMIPVFLEAGGRVVAPDFFGFGKSDKPVDQSVYTFEFHRNTLIKVIKHLDLRRITLVCQDWGGLTGLTLPMEMPERFDRMIVMNTALAVGESPGPGFDMWNAYVRSHPDLDVGGLMLRACPELNESEKAAYEAPFPDSTYKSGVRAFPELVPVSPDMPGAEISRRAVGFFKEKWAGSSFMAIGLQDPVLGKPVMTRLQSTIRGCPEPLLLEKAGHFVQEQGEEVARAALEYFDQ